MLPTYYADPAGNPVAIPDEATLLDLIRTKVIDGETWVHTEEGADWVSLASLPQWPEWLAAAGPQTTETPAQPQTSEPLRWPARAGWLLLGLALLVHFGLFYYTRGHFTAVDFFEEAGALAIAVGISARVGLMLQRRFDRDRAGQKPPLEGITLLTMAVGLSLAVTATSINIWKTYQEKGVAGLAFEDSLRGVDETLQVWATQMHEEYNAIWPEHDAAAATLDVEALETKPQGLFASQAAAKDGERRAREAAMLYRATAEKLRSLVTTTNERLQTLKITADLRAKQQKVWDEEFAPGYLSEADFMAAKGESMTALADLLAISSELMATGELTWNGSQVEPQTDSAAAQFNLHFGLLKEKYQQEDRLYDVMMEKNS